MKPMEKVMAILTINIAIVLLMQTSNSITTEEFASSGFGWLILCTTVYAISICVAEMHRTHKASTTKTRNNENDYFVRYFQGEEQV